MPGESTPSYRFGDLLALARQSWIARMSAELDALDYPGYRRSDAAVMRLLQRGPITIGRLGQSLAVTRQAARKVASGLERRGFATTWRDERDSRQVMVGLTPTGEAYARAVVDVIGRLNRELLGRVRPGDLAAADAVLRAAIFDEDTRRRADRIRPPPGADGRRPERPET